MFFQGFFNNSISISASRTYRRSLLTWLTIGDITSDTLNEHKDKLTSMISSLSTSGLFDKIVEHCNTSAAMVRKYYSRSMAVEDSLCLSSFISNVVIGNEDGTDEIEPLTKEQSSKEFDASVRKAHRKPFL